jgi:hypothetical protein
MSHRTLRILAIVYLVKALLVGAFWLAAPELAQRTWLRVRQAVAATLPLESAEAAEGSLATR